MKWRLLLFSLMIAVVMTIQSTAASSFHAASLPLSSSEPQVNGLISTNEASILLLLRYLHAAEATYMATAGNGRFGTLQELYLARLIDAKERTGFMFGYHYVLSVSNPTGLVSTFEVSAKPVTYMETGVRSFLLNHAAELRVSYLQNPSLSQFHLVTNECESTFCTEARARSILRNIHSAEATYQATAGNGSYGTLQQLIQQSLITASLASGILDGYEFRIRIDNGGRNEAPTFAATATPMRFPRTGAFSYYIDETGVLRGANKYGLEAEPSDQPICGN